MNITNPHAVSAPPSLSEIESPDRPATLDAILKQTLADANDKSNVAKASIESRLADPVDFAHPEKLIALQTELSDYNIYVSLASTLARKAVSAVETLVKAQ
ncbi:type III secretion system protein [Burkholderia sp. ABCPW 14]|uniref:Type III secretion system protein n=1 Tax=Burkholderia mayonis TaxID=1385591 RepID=A0A1B4G217_9BURK|nr:MULTISPECIES: type III secretion system inner rod subunit SctI [Burkholderia]AOJ09966.1 type III secretion system protein [Burkholderia mayonis]AOJ10151.1 type III secretion system protein [Burkholderia mayonis]KVD73611.1 type III secretion system protein [Burkholderia sp. ABCPW 14]KVE53368.1 type III secretion system protein [Burkholderia mayonis]